MNRYLIRREVEVLADGLEEAMNKASLAWPELLKESDTVVEAFSVVKVKPSIRPTTN